MFFDSFFAAPRSPLAVDPDSPEAAIIRFHDTACEGIVRALATGAGVLEGVLASAGSSAAVDLMPLVALDNPHLPALLELVLAGDVETRAAIVRAASLAEFLEVIDEVLSEFAGLAINRFGTADARRTAASLAPVLVHVAGLADPMAGHLLGDGVLPKVADLVGALEAHVNNPFQPFFQVFLAWKSDPARRLLAPAGHEGAVREPFTSLARAALVAGGSPGTLTAAVRTNLLVVELVEKSDDDLTPAEARYLVERTRRYAAVEREAAVARDTLAARFTAVPPPAGDRPVLMAARPLGAAVHPGFLGVVLRAFAVLCVVDHRVTSDEIWSVLDALRPLGIDIKQLHDLFIAACRAVHREGADHVADGMATELRVALQDHEAAGVSRAGLWRALAHTAGVGRDDAGRKARLLAEIGRGLGVDAEGRELPGLPKRHEEQVPDC